MSIESALVEYLKADAPLIAQISTRLYKDIAPPTAVTPYIVYQIIGSQPWHHLTAAADKTTKRAQFTVYSDSQLAVVTVANLLREALDGYRGRMGTENMDVRHIMLENESDRFDNPIDGGHQGLSSRIMEFVITHAQSVPSF